MDGTDSSGPRITQHADERTSQWHELRSLLTGPEQEQLTQILKRLNDPVRRAEELGRALPDAISISAARDGRIARALQPTIDTALKASVHKNPKAIADAIFPALGPAIRKAISTALMGMVQSFNHVLNQSLSLKGLKWRIEAIRTQRPFAEVVLLHTLVYRIEQIFLIHRQTGIVLQHAGANPDDTKDPDLVSGMLTAIQDFVKDSFDSETGEMLDTLRMDGDHSVWIEHGPEAILAAVIRGTPPVDLRIRFRELLDHVHHLYGETLNAFNGKVDQFAMVKPQVEDAMTFKVRQDKVRISPLLWLFAAVFVSILSLWSWQIYSAHLKRQDLLAQLKTERGIIVTAAERHDGRYIISGLKDPLARDPNEIISSTQLDPSDIRFQWQPFHAMDEITVLRRARHILQPPPTVDLQVDQGTLVVQGRASNKWVKRFRQVALAIPGIQSYNDTRLEDEEMDELIASVAELEKLSIYFDLGDTKLIENQKEPLLASLEILKRIQSIGQSTGILTRITLLGQTDATGPHERNLQLSQQRAQMVLNFLVRNGIDPVYLVAIGVGVKDTLEETTIREDLGGHRSVIFRTFIHPE